jgi:hypothetical protein
MSLSKIQGNLDAIKRMLGKANKIASKEENIKLGGQSNASG